MKIQYLKHAEIDFEKWDNCILQASNSLIYAESWYLNIVSPSWEALIGGNYEYVMPLPVKRKFGVSFLIQPPLTQQLGIFSRTEISEEILRKFIRKIPYLSYHLNLNEQNSCKNTSPQPNYLLDLNKSCEKLYADFSKNTKRNIEKANKSNIRVRDNLLPNEFLKFYFSTEKKYSSPRKNLASELIKMTFHQKKTTLYGVYNSENELISALCLLHSKGRFIYLLPVSNEMGKKTSAMFLIISEFIRQHSASSKLLDFEGSRVEGIARFYEGFGGKLKPYFEVKRLSVSDIITKTKNV
jgi:hypothetical protein